MATDTLQELSVHDALLALGFAHRHPGGAVVEHDIIRLSDGLVVGTAHAADALTLARSAEAA